MKTQMKVSGVIRQALVLALFGLGLALGGRTVTATTIVAWGDNTYGQTNVPSSMTNAIAIAQGDYHGLALNLDSTVAAWGCNFNPFTPSNYVGQATPPAGLSNVVAIAAGFVSSLALRSDGSVVAWGDTNQTNVADQLSNIVAISAGPSYSLGLRDDGTVVAWGDNYAGVTNVPPGLSNVVAVAAGGTMGVALLSNGTVKVWGWNGYGVTNVPANATNLVAVAAGYYHILALKADGTLINWGYTGYGLGTIPAGLTNVVAIAAGYMHSLALKKDGTVVAWGYNNLGQTNVPKGLSNVVAIAAIYAQSLALANDGAPWVVKAPASLTRYSGTNAAISVTAIGQPTLNYQWQFNGQNLSGATNSALAFTSLQVSNSGLYCALISNAFGVVTSPAATLAVIDSLPVILDQPTNQVVALRSNVSLAVTATGSLPLSYQWRFNGTNIARATNAVLTLTNAQWGTEGAYSVVISNAFGATVSSNAFLNVMDLAEALNTTNIVWTTSSGSGAWFAQGTVNHDGVAAAQSGAGSFGYLSSLQTTINGPGTLTYWGKVAERSDLLFLFASGGAPSLTSMVSLDWQSQTVYLGSGSQALQWQVEYPYFSTGLNAGYLDQINFTPGGTAPFITYISTNQILLAGTNASFSVQALGTPPFAYQWQFNGTDIEGATNSSLSLTNVLPADTGSYRVVVTNDYGSVTSSTAALTVLAAAILTDDGSFGLHSNQFCFTAKSAPGQVVVVETSTNLVNWAAFHTGLVTEAGMFFFADPDWAAFPRRYYRVRVN